MVSQLQPTNPLQSRLQLLSELPEGIMVTTEPFLTMTDLRFTGESAAGAAAAILGVEAPSRPNTWVTGSGDVQSVIWLGPDEWLVISDLSALPTREAELRAAVGPYAGAAVDVSGQRVKLTLSGQYVRDVLAKGCALDLHPSVFGPGSCAQTTLARAIVVLLAGENPDEFVVLVRQSFAGYLADWLIDAAEEFQPAP
jgi:sarcosine oxidase, subunit gamma